MLNGYSRWLKYKLFIEESPYWAETRRRVYAREKGFCQDCGELMYGKTYNVHHDPTKYDQVLYRELEGDNLQHLSLLCPKCHKKRHDNRPLPSWDELKKRFDAL